MNAPFNGQQLVGHVSPETAFVVADYPYGFRLRCQIRYWIETRKGFGQRFISQTSNPKKPGLVWNKPKADNYAPLIVMYQTADSGYVKYAALTFYADNLELIESFSALVLDDYQRHVQQSILAAVRRQRGASWSRDVIVVKTAPAPVIVGVTAS